MEGIVHEQVIIVVVRPPYRRHRLFDTLPLPGFKLFANAAQQGSACMLGTEIQQRRGQPGSLAGQTVAIAALPLVHAGREQVTVEGSGRLAITEEKLRTTVPHGEEIIIKVDELLFQTGDAMQEHLYRGGVEHRQETFRDDVMMQYDPEVPPVGPFRHLTLPRHHQIHIPDERHMHFDTPQEILQGPPVPEMLPVDILSEAGAICLLPDRIQAVDICDDCIHPKPKTP